MPSDLLSPKQAAALAGVTKVALWKSRQRGEIGAAAITSRGALYTRQAVTEWSTPAPRVARPVVRFTPGRRSRNGRRSGREGSSAGGSPL